MGAEISDKTCPNVIKENNFLHWSFGYINSDITMVTIQRVSWHVGQTLWQLHTRLQTSWLITVQFTFWWGRGVGQKSLCRKFSKVKRIPNFTQYLHFYPWLWHMVLKCEPENINYLFSGENCEPCMGIWGVIWLGGKNYWSVSLTVGLASTYHTPLLIAIF